MIQYCYQINPVRLACLIHAASVRSEPESNSQKKEFVKLLTQTFTVFSNIGYQRTRSPFDGRTVGYYTIFFGANASGNFTFLKKVG